MNECPYLRDCVLFRKTLDGLPDVAFLMKARHCGEEHERCSLHQIATELGVEQVPVGIYPNQTGRAESIIHEALGRSS